MLCKSSSSTRPGLACFVRLRRWAPCQAHVRSFTRNKDSGVSKPGTFLGFLEPWQGSSVSSGRVDSTVGYGNGTEEKIPHLLNLGINCGSPQSKQM